VVLCDHTGRILAIEGDTDFAGEVAERKNFRNGAMWSEETTGNNAIGTALATGQPHQVFSAEHFCRGWHDYICTAVPVCDPFTGKILGVFDITGTISDFHRHAYGQLLHIVRIIETALFRKGMAREYLFNREAMQVLNTIHSEALVITDVQGTIRAATAAAGELFSDLSDQGPAELVTITESLLEGHQSGKVITPYETMVTANGELCQARVRPLYHEQMLLGLEIRLPGSTSCLPQPKLPNPAISTKGSIIGTSPALTEALLKAEKVAPFISTVLLEGESGTGKELFARLIHDRSPRANGSFIPLNCAAIAPDLIGSELFGYDGGAFTGARAAGCKGKLELGDGGTVFLDEISEMPLAVQVILLRFLQEKEFYRVGGTRLVRPDVRIIAATNKPLHREMAAGHFRHDLFYRLNVINIELPPLRHRPEDILPLANHFLGQLSRETCRPPKRLDDEAREKIQGHSWPGNVRELQNVIEHAYVMSDSCLIRADELPCSEVRDQPVPESHQLRPRAAGRPELLAALNECGWNISLSARRLGISRATLYRHLKRHGIPLTR
jgi:transcriptional regulator of acetoin/glycerol metabolism